ncbi:endonuclease domain-containing protein [Geodermatophilus sp. SYSU D00691]
MPPAPTRPPELRGKVFRASHVVRAGLLTRSHLGSTAWQRVFPDVWACSSLRLTHGLRVMAATCLLLPGAAASGASAATIWGARLAEADDDVDLTVPPGFRGGVVPGVRLRRRALGDDEVTVHRGIRVTTRIRTALDLAAIRPPDEAVVAVDAFLVATRTPVDDVRAAAARASGRDCRYVRRTLARADGLAQSPQETRLRLLLGRTDLPEPVAQHRVRDASGFAGRVDFAWPEHKLALEYEGEWHGAPQQVPEDRERLNRIFAAGWRVIFVTKRDLRRPERLLARIRAALAAPTFA